MAKYTILEGTNEKAIIRESKQKTYDTSIPELLEQIEARKRGAQSQTASHNQLIDKLKAIKTACKLEIEIPTKLRIA